MILTQLNEKVRDLFEKAGFDKNFSLITSSDRPDLSDFQCNGALQAAKILKRRPLDIAKEMQAILESCELFSSVTVDGPGFINLCLSEPFIIENLGLYSAEMPKPPIVQKIILDYGGPNVAKPLHVGHLRSAIIGESLKRIAHALGHEVISDIHLGDWGTPMGMLLCKLELDHPEWPYFQDPFIETTETCSPPLTVEEMNTLYPQAASLFKQDETFAGKAREATALLQAGHPGYRKLWRHLVNLSIESIKKDFNALDVHFDLWLGESDADAFVQNIIESQIQSGNAKESDDALVIDIVEEQDKHTLPPLILRKKDGAATYATTDLATIYQRIKEYHPDKILYVVDQRQSLHFTQVFRAANKAGFSKLNQLEHIGFGTMNGKDGKPFKTREGGVMRLSDFISSAIEAAFQDTNFSKQETDPHIHKMIGEIAVAAIKFGDLSNVRTTDYIFDLNEFIRFEGRTGPYIQYSTVRAKAIIKKADLPPMLTSLSSGFTKKVERDLSLTLLEWPLALQKSFEKRMPSEICDYAYKLAYIFNKFYHDCNVLKEQNLEIRQFRLFLVQKTSETLQKVLHCLAIPVPQKMLRGDVS